MTMRVPMIVMAFLVAPTFAGDAAKLPAVTAAVQSAVDAKEIPGAVTAVVT